MTSADAAPFLPSRGRGCDFALGCGCDFARGYDYGYAFDCAETVWMVRNHLKTTRFSLFEECGMRNVSSMANVSWMETAADGHPGPSRRNLASCHRASIADHLYYYVVPHLRALQEHRNWLSRRTLEAASRAFPKASPIAGASCAEACLAAWETAVASFHAAVS